MFHALVRHVKRMRAHRCESVGARCGANVGFALCAQTRRMRQVVWTGAKDLLRLEYICELRSKKAGLR